MILIRPIRRGHNIGPLLTLSPSRHLRTALGETPTNKLATLGNMYSLAARGRENDANDRIFVEAAVSASNELSTVFWTDFDKALPGGFLFTSDAGPRALKAATTYARYKEINLKTLAAYQIPHHGSSENFPDESRSTFGRR